MTTIRKHIQTAILGARRERLAALQRLQAPQILIDAEAKMIAEHEAGSYRISGKPELLDIEFSVVEAHKGNGGKPYFVFDDAIAWFPRARFGHYVKPFEQKGHKP